MTTLTERKAQARRAAFARRKEAHAKASGQGTANLSEVLRLHRGKTIGGYMPIRTEIDPLPAMAEASKFGPVAVPVIEAEAQPLKFSRWTPGCALRDGPFGAQVPEHDDFVEPEVLIVPLVAYNHDGGRLGYGGGFYDRTIERLLSRGPLVTIGFAYAAQFAADLPLEPTDQPLNMIVTEQDIWRR